MMKKIFLTLSVVIAFLSGCTKREYSDNIPIRAKLDDITVEGELLKRIERNFNRLNSPQYSVDKVFKSPAAGTDPYGWPGDMEGRTILALVLDAQATKQESTRLREMLGCLPQWLNPKGYMGLIHENFIDEQQLSGNGWMLRALCEYAEWKNDETMRPIIQKLASSLFLPWKGEYAKYPINPNERVKGVGEASGHAVSLVGKWRLSSDIGCVFIGMAGLAHAYAYLKDPSLLDVLDEMIARFLETDLVAVYAQTHASLTAMRGIIRYAQATGKLELIVEVIERFDLYCTRGMTENYANYNWFGRNDTWTEPCAIVDSYIIAAELWRYTGNPRYIEIADRIYLNALCRAQRENGGFGLENCPGRYTMTDTLRVHDTEAHWCCTMRGAEGLAAAARNVVFHRNNEIYLPFFRNFKGRVCLNDGMIVFEEKYDIPLGNDVHIRILTNDVGIVTINLRKSDWMQETRVTLNNKELITENENGFLKFSKSLKSGDEIKFSFRRSRRWEDVINTDNSPNRKRAFYGPLQLGSLDKTEDINKLSPIYHLLNPEISKKNSGEIQILFSK
jgi:hypothetical protein